MSNRGTDAETESENLIPLVFKIRPPKMRFSTSLEGGKTLISAKPQML